VLTTAGVVNYLCQSKKRENIIVRNIEENQFKPRFNLVEILGIISSYNITNHLDCTF